VVLLKFTFTEVVWLANLDLPARAVEFDDLHDRQGQGGSEQGDPLGFPEYPHDTDLAAEVLEHDPLVVGQYVARLAVEKNRNTPCLLPVPAGARGSRSPFRPILAGAPPLLGGSFRG